MDKIRQSNALKNKSENVPNGLIKLPIIQPANFSTMNFEKNRQSLGSIIQFLDNNLKELTGIAEKKVREAIALLKQYYSKSNQKIILSCKTPKKKNRQEKVEEQIKNTEQNENQQNKSKKINFQIRTTQKRSFVKQHLRPPPLLTQISHSQIVKSKYQQKEPEKVLQKDCFEISQTFSSRQKEQNSLAEQIRKCEQRMESMEKQLSELKKEKQQLQKENYLLKGVEEKKLMIEKDRAVINQYLNECEKKMILLVCQYQGKIQKLLTEKGKKWVSQPLNFY